jgi:hypothetical protein
LARRYSRCRAAPRIDLGVLDLGRPLESVLIQSISRKAYMPRESLVLVLVLVLDPDWCWCWCWCWYVGAGACWCWCSGKLRLGPSVVLGPLWPTPRSLDGFVLVLVLAWCRGRSPPGLFPFASLAPLRCCPIPGCSTARLPRRWVGTVLGRGMCTIKVYPPSFKLACLQL